MRGQIGAVDAVFAHVARHFTVRLAKVLAQYLSSLMRKAESLVTPETECLLYTTYWFRPLLSELIGAATESWEVNRARAPSGPVKAVVSQQPRLRPNAGLTFSLESRPYLHGFRPVGPASLHPPSLEMRGLSFLPRRSVSDVLIEFVTGCSLQQKTKPYRQ